MSANSLFARTSTFKGVYVMLLANRLQMLFFVLMMPAYLAYPFMILGILAMGIVAQINLTLLSKWYASDFSAKGYGGFVELFGERIVRLAAFVGLFFILVRLMMVTHGYVDVINHTIFPSMNRTWLVLIPLLVSCYLASKGMENTVRFVIVVFLSTAWVFIVYILFFLTPSFSIRDLFPLMPETWTTHTWKSLLYILSALSGPEYLVFLAPWLNAGKKTLKYLTIANAITIAEYLVLFIASLLFYGSNYLRTVKYPGLDMMRYIQSPFFERIDIVLLSVHVIYFVYAISLFLLCFYGAFRVMAGRVHAPTTRFGFITICLLIVICHLVVNKWFWDPGTLQKRWIDLHMWLGAFSFFTIPACLLIALKRKGRV